MMATVIRALKSVNTINIIKSFTNMPVHKNIFSAYFSVQAVPTIHKKALLHTTSKKYDLMEFFDHPDNWAKDEIRTGRSWTKDELRIKSNEDLHKLWYVLLKERNMIITMEYRYKELFKIMPSPERYDKVVQSMHNLEIVVRERNEAYYYLETGESGEQPSKYIYNVLGMKTYYKFRQYIKPKQKNTTWKSKNKFGFNGYAVRKFLRLYHEKLWDSKRKLRNRQMNTAISLIRRFPNLDIEALQEKYPLVDVDKLFRHNKLKSLRLRSRDR